MTSLNKSADEVSVSTYLDTEQTQESLAADIAKHASPGLIILLRGDLGAGKTTFARGFLRGLGSGGG